ncbi:cell division protein ZapA [Azovibrio restrictus]|uniref:cell division protein ZapA n=1 Tax=Azovibrio restrictus TaxID=146938 RepID=UPI0004796DAF|nr:cell division protein ZapA [Azovibrio restrictus]MCE1170792.1 cell division protein ZapA [Azovibrio sp.]MDD3481702.1 cell division protein ZapA [Azovibrio restrictus]
MSGEASFLDVKILGREYRVACPPGEQEALLAAVRMVDDKMQDIAHKTKNTVPERVAVMAALNIAHEHLSATKGAEMSFDSSGVKRRIEAMDTRLNALLDQQELDI